MADLKKTDIAEPRNLRDDLNAIQPILKAHIISRENLAATNVQESEEDQAFANAGAIEPPYDPGVLCKLFEHSNSLRQNVDAYVTNIDGFGHRFEPVINLESDDSSEQIREALLLDRLHRQSSGDEDIDLEAMPTDQEVEDRRKKLSMQIRLEKSKLINFFDFCCVDQSFIQLRKYTRQDIEVGGNGYWEVLRNGDGDVAQFTYLPAFTVRLLPLDKIPIAVKQKIRVSPLTFKIVEMQRRFRRFVQIFQTQAIFFKEFGDPRIISKKDGRVVASEDEFEKDDPDDGPATEVWHFSVHNPESSYGVPRWIGNLLSVLGSRQSEEVNFLYFDNKGVPPLALMVSGGKLSGSSVDRIKDHIENMKGLKNFHSIMIIEAESSNTKSDAENAGRIRIDLKPLTSAQHNDALFQKYDERNIDKVGMAFRLPRMLRGDIRDFNRSTADAALAFAEMQVFQPERQDFDFSANRKLLLNELGIRFWRFISNAPVTRDPEVVAKMIKDLMNSNAFTALDVRPLLEEVFNREFRTLRADWAKQPVPLTLAGIPVEESKGELEIDGPKEDPFGRRRNRRRGNKKMVDAAIEEMSLSEQAVFLIKLRDALAKAEADEAEQEHREAKERVAQLKAAEDAE